MLVDDVDGFVGYFFYQNVDFFDVRELFVSIPPHDVRQDQFQQLLETFLLLAAK